MKPVVALIAPGNMGAAVGKRLTENGLQVLTSLAGRSEESVARARAAGMTDASPDQIAAADLILSIVPPGDALSLAERLAPALARGNRKPAYVDCMRSIRRPSPASRRRSRPPPARSSTPASSAARPSRGPRAPLSTPPAPRRRALPCSTTTASTCACSTAASAPPRR
jgi:predicted dinucleotide-binding enzyme